MNDYVLGAAQPRCDHHTISGVTGNLFKDTIRTYMYLKQLEVVTGKSFQKVHFLFFMFSVVK